MGVDIASLVLAVDSTQVDKGSKALEEMAKQGEKASASASDMTSSTTTLAASLGRVEAGVGIAVTAVTTLAAGVVRLILPTINAADAMNDMRLKTGLAFKDLAAYDLLARQGVTTIDGMAQGVKFLSKNLVENRKELQAIGVTSSDTNVALGQFADLIAGINDPALKTAVAMKYMERSGVALLPALSGGSAAISEARRQTERYGEYLEKVAPKADQFNDNLSVLSTNARLLGYSIAESVLPRLNRLTDDIVKASEKSGSLGTAWAGLAGVASWVVNPIVALGTQLTIAFTEVAVSFNKMMATITTGNTRSEFLAQAAKESGNLSRLYKQLADLDVSGGNAAQQHAAGVKKLTTAEEEALRAAIARGEDTRSGIDAHESAVKAAATFIESLKKEAETYGATEAEKQRYEARTLSLALNLGKERNAFMASAEALIEKQQALRDLSAEARIHNDLVQKFFDAEQAEQDKINAGIEFLRLKIEALDEETVAMGLVGAALREHLILRALEKSGLDASTTAYQRMNEELHRATSANEIAREAKKSAEEQKQLWRSIESSAHDAFMHIGESGRTVFERLQDTLKNGILEMLYQMTVKKWIIQIEEHYTQSGTGKAVGSIIDQVGGSIGKWVGGLFNSDSYVPSQGFGMAGDAGTILGFAGGGDTGSGPRSGGLDGQGGFLAVLHPQETVIDRTKGDGNSDISMSMPVSITINGNADASVIRQALAETEARIYRNVPAIVRQAQIRNRTTPNL